MTDHQTRSLERLALQGLDPADQARHLVERQRRAPACEPCGGSGRADLAEALLLATLARAMRANGCAR